MVLSVAEFDSVGLRMFEGGFKLHRFFRLILEAIALTDSLSVYVDGQKEKVFALRDFDIDGDLVPGTNIDDDFRWYVTITADFGGAGDHKISIYADAARSVLVMEDTSFLDATGYPQQLTLAEQGSSGLSGTCFITADPVSTDATIALLVTESLLKAKRRLFQAGGEPDYDDVLADLFNDFVLDIRGNLQSVITSVEDFVIELFRYANAKMNKNRAATFINKRTEGGLNSAITLNPQGLAEEWYDEMVLGSESVAVRDGTAGARTIPATYIEIDPPTIDNPFRPGTITAELRANDIGAHSFSVYLTPAEPFWPNGNKEVIRARRNLQMGYAWSDAKLGVRAWKLGHLLTAENTVGGGGAQQGLDETHATGTIQGANSLVTPNSTVYYYIRTNGANFDIEFYPTLGAATDPDNNSGVLYSQATNVAAGASFTSTAQNGSGLVIEFVLGTGAADGQIGNISWAVGVIGEKITFDITEDGGAGLIQQEFSFFSENQTHLMPESGSPTFLENLITRGFEAVPGG